PADQENDYDILAVNAASAALSLSNAPFEGPIGCVRVGTVNGELTLNPTIQQMLESDLDLVVAGTRDSIMMMEAGARQVTEEFLIEALALAQEGIRKICDAQADLQRASGKPKLEYIPVVPEASRLGTVTSFLSQRLRAKLRNPDKAQREAGLDDLKLEAIAQFAAVEGAALTQEEVTAVFEEILEQEFRKAVTEEDLRPDAERDARGQRGLGDGLDMRIHARPAGRGGPDQGDDRRHRDGPGDLGRQVDRPYRHPGPRGPLRRHGFQSRRLGQGHHSAADGHKDQGDLGRDHARGVPAGARGAALHHRRDAQRHRQAS